MTPRKLSVGAAIVGLVLLPFADLQITTATPGAELARMAAGLLSPTAGNLGTLLHSAMQTFAFGVLGSLIAAPIGLVLALAWGSRVVRWSCASVRAIHELFWALLLMQIFGLSTWTGLLALAIPYSGIFAKVFAEILTEQEDDAVQALPRDTDVVSRWLLVRLPAAWPQMRSYAYTRIECGLRASTILGFVGLPTLGYHLEAALAYGAYSEAAGLLICLIALIAGFRLLLPAWSWPVWLIALPWVLPAAGGLNASALARLLTQDLWPTSILTGDWLDTLDWLYAMLTDAIVPGLLQTLLLCVLALIATGLCTLLLWPLATRSISGWPGLVGGQALLLVLRSTPEYLLAYILLLAWGPSMLPAIVALMLHNAAIIAFLMARQSDRLKLRIDAPGGLNRYSWEVLPRLYGPFIAYLLYRWEIILRESAVVGLLGIYTLGYYVDSALAELRLDRLLPLLLAMVVLNISVDACSRRLRQNWAFTRPQPLAATGVTPS